MIPMDVSAFLVVGGVFGLWMISGSRGDRLEIFLAESVALRPFRWPGVRTVRAWVFEFRAGRVAERLLRNGKETTAREVIGWAAVHSAKVRAGLR